ncbi:MAG: hypothetical protein L3J32_08865 [Rhizobiaceae bacterium]|nr:hypothetical protein [Rhizobiaceae bacterium]
MLPAEVGSSGTLRPFSGFNSPISIIQMVFWSAAAISSLGVLFAFSIFQPDFSRAEIFNDKPIKSSTLQERTIVGTTTPATVSENTEPGISVIAKVNTSPPGDTHSQEGYGISLGEGQSLFDLSKRYRQISQLNSFLFINLEPRAVFVDSGSRLVAKLIAGPFVSKQEAAITCGILNLPDGIICNTHPFGSDLITLSGNEQP